jgi:hypothetical protein
MSYSYINNINSFTAVHPSLSPSLSLALSFAARQCGGALPRWAADLLATLQLHLRHPAGDFQPWEGRLLGRLLHWVWMSWEPHVMLQRVEGFSKRQREAQQGRSPLLSSHARATALARSQPPCAGAGAPRRARRRGGPLAGVRRTVSRAVTSITTIASQQSTPHRSARWRAVHCGRCCARARSWAARPRRAAAAAWARRPWRRCSWWRIWWGTKRD